ncbi:MAG: Hsp20 family protein [Candidatus Berkelbacteria bacterium]|nr:Hsp20 family protein [Candidatus Berkelbacteria bacterium]
MVVKKELASHLKKYREIAEITQGEMADRLGISRQSIISLESGKCVPSVALALRVSELFGMPVEFIFRQNNDENIDEQNSIENKKENIMNRDLLPWSPLREIMSLRETVDRFFEEPSLMSKNPVVFHPTIGIRETDKELIIEADLPGVEEKDIELEVENDKIIIRGERKLKEEIKKENYYHLESSFGSFSRIIGLPNYVNADRADAKMENGILEIKLPKVEEKKSKKIPIKATPHKPTSTKLTDPKK